MTTDSQLKKSKLKLMKYLINNTKTQSKQYNIYNFAQRDSQL